MAGKYRTTPVPSLTRDIFVPNYKKHIGVDAFSNVFKIKLKENANHEAAGRLVALKLFKEDKSVVEDVKSVKSRELKILQSVGEHEFIARFYGMYLNEGLFVGLVFEYAELGNWDDFIYEHMIENNKDFFAVRCHQSRCLASALAYLHGRDVVHGDIFIENVLVFAPDFRLKLSNFASSFCASDPDTPPSFPFNVDDSRACYRAPEKRIPPSDGGKSLSSFPTDVFSFGVLLLFAFFQRNEFLEQYTSSWDWDQLKQEIQSEVQRKEDFPPGIASIILRCVKFHPKARMSIDDVCHALDQLNCPDLQDQLNELASLVESESANSHLHRSPSGAGPFALARPMSLTSHFSGGQNVPQPVFGGLAMSPLSALFPSFEKRTPTDSYMNELHGDFFTPYSRGTSYLHPYSPAVPSVEHKREDVDVKKLKAPSEKPSGSVIKSIMHHRDVQTKWRAVLLHLSMKENDLRLVEARAKEHRETSENIDDAAIVHYALDSVWLEQAFDTATRAKLLDALMKAGCYDSAFTFVNMDYDLD